MHITIWPKGGRLRKWSSHLPVLIKVISMTKGPVLELGMGFYSTPFLHWSCRSDKRELVSYETDPHYFEAFRQFGDFHHKIFLAEDCNTIPIEREWEVAFIDIDPFNDKRNICAKRLANCAKYVVIHDSEPEGDGLFGFSKIYSLFKYRYDYKDTFPHTSILSNFVDVKDFKVESEGRA